MPESDGVGLAGLGQHHLQGRSAFLSRAARKVECGQRSPEGVRSIFKVRRAWSGLLFGGTDSAGGNKRLAVAKLESHPAQRGAWATAARNIYLQCVNAAQRHRHG